MAALNDSRVPTLRRTPLFISSTLEPIAPQATTTAPARTRRSRSPWRTRTPVGAAVLDLDPLGVALGHHARAGGDGVGHVGLERRALAVVRAAPVAQAGAAAVVEVLAEPGRRARAGSPRPRSHSARQPSSRTRPLPWSIAGSMRATPIAASTRVVGGRERRGVDRRAEPLPARERVGAHDVGVVEPEADAVVDQRRAAEHAALEHGHAEIDRGLQPALLVEQRGHRVLAPVEVARRGRAGPPRAGPRGGRRAAACAAITAPPAPEPITHRSASITSSPGCGRAHGERRQRERLDRARARDADGGLHGRVVVVAGEEQHLELGERPQQRAPAR